MVYLLIVIVILCGVIINCDSYSVWFYLLIVIVILCGVIINCDSYSVWCTY